MTRKETLSNPRDEFYMSQALNEAMNALEDDEVPIGAVVVCNDRIIGRGHNQTESLNDVTAHAEMIALTSAENYLGAKYLKECTLYVTVEPCIMCAGAIGWSQIGRLVYGSPDPKKGFTKFCKDGITPLHPATIVTPGVLGEVSSHIMSDFFKSKRK